jgi:hypothetical protein
MSDLRKRLWAAGDGKAGSASDPPLEWEAAHALAELEAENARLGEQLAAAYNEHFGTAVDWAGKALSATEQRRRAEAAEAKLKEWNDAFFALTDMSNWPDMNGDWRRGYKDAMDYVHEYCMEMAEDRRTVTALTDKEDE